jgi:hypothetical protein
MTTTSPGRQRTSSSNGARAPSSISTSTSRSATKPESTSGTRTTSVSPARGSDRAQTQSAGMPHTPAASACTSMTAATTSTHRRASTTSSASSFDQTPSSHRAPSTRPRRHDGSGYGHDSRSCPGRSRGDTTSHPHLWCDRPVAQRRVDDTRRRAGVRGRARRNGVDASDTAPRDWTDGDRRPPAS